MGSGQCYFTLLRGAWRDRDTNDIFAHCSLIFYFLDFKFSKFVCPSKLHPFIWSFFKNSVRKNIWKTTQNALAPSIFVVLSIVLKLGTPLLHTQAQNSLLQNFRFPSAQWFCLLQCHDVIAYDNDALLYLGAQAMNQRDHILYAPQHIHPNLQVCLLIEVLDANISICSSDRWSDWLELLPCDGLRPVLLHALKGSVDRSRHERHFCSLLPYFLLSWLQFFLLCLAF